MTTGASFNLNLACFTSADGQASKHGSCRQSGKCDDKEPRRAFSEGHIVHRGSRSSKGICFTLGVAKPMTMVFGCVLMQQCPERCLYSIIWLETFTVKFTRLLGQLFKKFKNAPGSAEQNVFLDDAWMNDEHNELRVCHIKQ